MCRLHKKMKATSEVDYPAYGVTGPVQPGNGKEGRSAGSPGDRKLAQSAQMYHYQHQKQQMIASERYDPPEHSSFGVLPIRLIFTVSFRVTVCLGLGIGLGIGLGSGLGELGLGEVGLGEMGQNPYFYIG